MAEFEPRDRVQDACWGGRYVGTVEWIGSVGEVYVKWDGLPSAAPMSPYDIVLLERAGSRS